MPQRVRPWTRFPGGRILVSMTGSGVVSGDPPVEGDNAERINALLDDYTLPSIMTGLQYPADPVTTTTHEVRTNAELTAAVGGNGRRILIRGPGNGWQATYSQFSLTNRSDIDIVMDNDATITGGGGWWHGVARRIRWTGGNAQITTGTNDGFTFADIEDLLFDDVRIYRTSGEGHAFLWNGSNHRRVALINSTVEQTFIGGNAPNVYAMFTFSNHTTASDWIWLKNRLIGQGGAVRIMSMGTRIALVDNYFTEQPGVNGSIRIHENNDGLWFAHNVHVNAGGNGPMFSFLVSGGADPNSTAIMTNFVVEDNKLFGAQSNFPSGQAMRFGDSQAGNFDQMTNLVSRRNTWFDPDGPTTPQSHGWYQNMSASSYAAEDNFRIGPGHPDYETAPAASSFGAQR
jgi:hypothetical protein